VTIPTDPQSGQPTGQRVHKPLIVTKPHDRASPLLYNALTSGERLPRVLVRFYRLSAAGKTEDYFTTELEDAIVVDIQTRDAGAGMVEDVAFAYRKVTWSHVVGNTSGSDDWRAPVAAY